MKLTVNKYLNARIGAPSTNAPCQFYRSPGDSIEVDAVVVGAKIDGNSVWYKNVCDDCYYWSGGVEEMNFSFDGLNPDLLPVDERMELLAEAKDYYWEYYSARLSNLSGIRIGSKFVNGVPLAEDDTLVFQVVEKSADVPDAEMIPALLYYRGFAITTDVIQADIGEAQVARPGDSIARINSLNDWGSVGLKVSRTEDGETDHFLLTNYHVACNDLLRNNVMSYQPSVEPELPNRDVLVSENASEITAGTAVGAVYEGELSLLFDVSLTLLDRSDLATNVISGNRAIKRPLEVFNDKNFQGAAVKMFGAKSGEQNSRIVSVNSSQFFSYNNRTLIKKLLNLIELQRCSNPGDSGSPVVLGDAVIGILIGADNKSSYVIPINRILKHLTIKISQS